MNEFKTCPICDWPEPEVHGGFEEPYYITCPRCGKFCATEDALEKAMISKEKPRLSAWIRRCDEYGESPPRITGENIDSILNDLPSYSINEKQLLLLRAIEKRTSYPGEEVTMDSDKDFPLAWAKHSDEFEFLIESLKDRGLISRLPAYGVHVTITANGWDYLDNHDIHPDTDHVFVAMSFDEQMNDAYYSGIKLAIEEAGYKSYRMDKEPNIEPINAKMIAEIKSSKFVVVDVTKERQNVYFEAGYAMALNRPVIFCAKKDTKIHFDTQMLPRLIWETPKELKEKLFYIICAVIGKKEKAKV
ncbi:MAG: hypothetical protein HQK56_19425 [Deltaproteobacteria bacterium]|nr:hypothetical protein [Deltaproteobacteria bacterium]